MMIFPTFTVRLLPPKRRTKGHFAYHNGFTSLIALSQGLTIIKIKAPSPDVDNEDKKTHQESLSESLHRRPLATPFEDDKVGIGGGSLA